MRALFCHDHVFALDGAGKVYSSGQFSASIWDRYLEVFDTLTVAGRCRRLPEAEATAGLNLASRPGVSFVFLPNLASIAGLMWRRIEAKRILQEETVPSATPFASYRCIDVGSGGRRQGLLDPPRPSKRATARLATY